MARVLVVDDDSWAQRMVAAVLSNDGHEVGLAADASEGALAAAHVRPELLIVKTALPDLDGWEFVGRVRARPELAAVPTLFLVSGPAPGRRRASFRPETDDILGKPFSAEALQAKVKRLLHPDRTAEARREFGEALANARPDKGTEPRARRPAPAPAPVRSPGKRSRSTGVALVGRLDEFGAASILMLLELERRSGLLIISAAPGSGRIEVRRGRALRARIEAQPEYRGAAAIFQLLAWNEGRFEFHPGQVDGEDEVRASTSFLLLEAARKQDEEAAATKRRN